MGLGRKILAAVGTVITLTKPVIWLIDKVGEVDVVRDHLGEIGPFLNSGWGTLTTVLSGCALIAWAIYNSRHQKTAPISAPGEKDSPRIATVRGKTERKIEEMQAETALLHARRLQQKQEDHSTVRRPTAPDWPLRQLFIHLCPGISRTKDERQFEEASSEILDKLATGQVAAWGRALSGHRRLPLYPIPQAYWLHAKFVPWLLDVDGGTIWQTSPVDHRVSDQTQYAEVQLNKAQALTIWPAREMLVERDIALADALAYAVTGKWDRQSLWETEGEPIANVGNELKRFEQLACDGLLQAWGMRHPNLGPYVKIRADYWDGHHIHFMDLFREKAGASSYTHVDTNREYFDVMVSSAQFEKYWPHQ